MLSGFRARFHALGGSLRLVRRRRGMRFRRMDGGGPIFAFLSGDGRQDGVHFPGPTGSGEGGYPGSGDRSELFGHLRQRTLIVPLHQKRRKHPGWAASCRFRVPRRPVAYAVRGPLSGRNPRARAFSAYADARRRRPRPFSCRSDGFALWDRGFRRTRSPGCLRTGRSKRRPAAPPTCPAGMQIPWIGIFNCAPEPLMDGVLDLATRPPWRPGGTWTGVRLTDRSTGPPLLLRGGDEPERGGRGGNGR